MSPRPLGSHVQSSSVRNVQLHIAPAFFHPENTFASTSNCFSCKKITGAGTDPALIVAISSRASSAAASAAATVVSCTAASSFKHLRQREIIRAARPHGHWPDSAASIIRGPDAIIASSRISPTSSISTGTRRASFACRRSHKSISNFRCGPSDFIRNDGKSTSMDSAAKNSGIAPSSAAAVDCP